MTTTHQSFLKFIGNIPYSASAASLALMDELRQRQVVWITELSKPPLFHNLEKIARGRSVLSFGSLEGNLEWMLASAGAARVVGVEGFSENYRKCVLLQTIFPHLPLEFVQADAQTLAIAPEFDIIICAGLFYHLHQPQELLRRMRDAKPRLVYFNTQLAVDASHPASAFHSLSEAGELLVEGRTYGGRWWPDVRKHHRDYLCGLEERPSFWFYPDELRRLLEDFGFGLLDWNCIDLDKMGRIVMAVLTVQGTVPLIESLEPLAPCEHPN